MQPEPHTKQIRLLHFLSLFLCLPFYSSPLPSNGDGEMDGEICAAATTTITTVSLEWWYPEERGQGSAKKLVLDDYNAQLQHNTVDAQCSGYNHKLYRHVL